MANTLVGSRRIRVLASCIFSENRKIYDRKTFKSSKASDFYKICLPGFLHNKYHVTSCVETLKKNLGVEQI